MSVPRLNPYYPGKMAVIRKERSVLTAVQRAIDAAWSSANETAWLDHRADALDFGMGVLRVQDGEVRRIDPIRDFREPVIWFDEFADTARKSRWWAFWR